MTRVLLLTGVRVRRQFLDWSGGWWFLLTLVANEAIGPLVGLFVWSTVFPDDPRVVSYFVALIAVQLMTASYENHTFSETVYQGTVSHELLKPQPVVIGPIGENLAIRIWLTMVGVPLTVLGGAALGASYALGDIALALPALLVAAVLRFLFTWTLALMAFWTEQVHAVVSLAAVLITLLGGSAAPVSVLPEPWHTIVRALPFYPMLGLPADIATGAADLGDVVFGLGWIAVLGVLAFAVWRRGIRRYTVIGA